MQTVMLEVLETIYQQVYRWSITDGSPMKSGQHAMLTAFHWAALSLFTKNARGRRYPLANIATDHHTHLLKAQCF